MRFKLMLNMLFMLLLVSTGVMADCSSQQIFDEIRLDPTGIGLPAAYGPTLVVGCNLNTTCANGSDGNVLALLNQPRAGIQVNRGILPSSAVIGAIDDAELDAMCTTSDCTRANKLQVLLAGGSVDFSSSSVRQMFNRLFPSAVAPISRAALLALALRNGSRAEQLCGKPLTLADISLAIRNSK